MAVPGQYIPSIAVEKSKLDSAVDNEEPTIAGRPKVYFDISYVALLSSFPPPHTICTITCPVGAQVRRLCLWACGI